jgi:putative membrane protein
MTFNSARSMMLGAAIMLCSAAVLAQNEPGGMPSTMPQGNPAPSGQPQPGPSQQRTPPPSMQDSSDSGQTVQMMKDKMFLRAAAAGGIAEVQFGQLATQKGNSEDVKTFGQKMVDDHTTLNKDMESIADSMGVKLSTHMNKDDQAEYDKLKGLSGDDFDKEYITLMVRDHHHDLREFRLEAANTQDQTLKNAVVKGQKVIHEHLEMVNSLARDKGIDVPHRGGNAAPPPPQ